jgi:hypothetical protein
MDGPGQPGSADEVIRERHPDALPDERPVQREAWGRLTGMPWCGFSFVGIDIHAVRWRELRAGMNIVGIHLAVC